MGKFRRWQEVTFLAARHRFPRAEIERLVDKFGAGGAQVILDRASGLKIPIQQSIDDTMRELMGLQKRPVTTKH